jgi:nucleoside 2-deoxyribosyltransferase
MRPVRSVYLAAPAMPPSQALSFAEDARTLCEAAGFTAVGLDVDPLVERAPSEAMAREIYAHRLAKMRQADAAIVNLSPFRGPHCDPAIAFEAGFFSGMARPVFAYMNLVSEAEAELKARVAAYVGAEPDADGIWRDDLGAPIEDYGLPESLILWAEARRLYVIVTPDPEADLTGLQLCLDAVKLYAD